MDHLYDIIDIVQFIFLIYFKIKYYTSFFSFNYTIDMI